MKTATRRPTTATLENGDRLSQVDFHARYEAYPEDVKIELIGGVVHMASPMRGPHGRHTSKISMVLGIYEASTPGIEVADGITIILGKENEPQPDLLLRLLPECGGISRYNEEQYLVGPPELIVEVSHSTRSIDMNAKRLDYLDAGVQEYLVVCVEEQELHWFHFPSKRMLKPTKANIWKSLVFPGLWIDGPGLFALDGPKLIATVQKGLASTKHADFVKILEKRREV